MTYKGQTPEEYMAWWEREKARQDALQGELLERLAEMQAEDDEGFMAAWTWLDADPSVAWNDEDSYHGKLAALYEDAGWERCYHNERARFHFDVKLNGNGRHYGFRDNVPDVEDERLFESIANSMEEMEIESWWEDLAYDIADLLETKRRETFYSCGRSGGYVNCREMETDPESMIKVGFFLERERAARNHYEAGKYLAESALEEYNDRKVADLASARPERIEA